MSVDDKMEKCPLKQEIREKLWLEYIKKLKKSTINYLTLYCPVLTDVKFLEEVGVVSLEEDMYKGVGAVTNNAKDFLEAAKKDVGKPEFLQYGAISELKRNTKDVKEFFKSFPYDAINLDYCGHIHESSDAQYLSSDLKDIKLIINEQNETSCDSFILFVTTRTDENNNDKKGLSKQLLKAMTRQVVKNLKHVEIFKNQFEQTYGDMTADKLRQDDFCNFLNIGIIKFISTFLAKNNYTISDCDITWLQRDTGSPETHNDLLHCALHIERGKPEIIHPGGNDLSTQDNFLQLEKNAYKILPKIRSNDIKYLKISEDYKTLNRRHEKTLERLKNKTFESKILVPPHL